MESMKDNRTMSFVKSHKGRMLIAVTVALLVASIGILWLMVRAAGLFSAVETDTGTLTTNAKVVSDANASGGKVVQFTAPVVATPPPPATGYVSRFGMSAPADKWDLRVAEVGGKTNLKFRRIFLTGFDAGLSLVQRAINDGMVPILSFKVAPYSWSQVASGAADADIRAMVKRLDAIPGEKFVALHHEPAKDGLAQDWAAMQVHALPIITTGQNVSVGVIGNGWWWSNAANGYTDAEIATYIPREVIAVSDVIAADTYQSAVGAEGAAPKIRNMAAWARRVGGVKAIGIGEFNGQEAKTITEAMNVIKLEPLIKWACIWNSTAGVGYVLEGDRLEAFKTALATPDQT